MRRLLLLAFTATAVAQSTPQLYPPPAPPAITLPTVESNEAPPPSLSIIPGLFNADRDMRMLELVLDDGKIFRIPTHPTVNTTIIFPEPIGGLDGAGFTLDPSVASGDFLLAFTPGASHITITPLTEAARRNINVVIGGRVYVIEAYPVPSFVLATASAKFVRQVANFVRNGMGGTYGATDEDLLAKRSAAPPKPQFQPAGAAKLVGLLDVIKLFSGLRKAELEATLRAMPHIQLATRGRAAEIQDCGHFTLHLDRVVRNNKIDAIAFEVTVRNKTKRPIVFDPESFAVRVGDQLHPQVVTDFAPTLGAGQEAKAYFVIITSPDGTPNYLAVDNDFQVSVTEGLSIDPDPMPQLFPDGKAVVSVTRTVETVSNKGVPAPARKPVVSATALKEPAVRALTTKVAPRVVAAQLAPDPVAMSKPIAAPLVVPVQPSPKPTSATIILPAKVDPPAATALLTKAETPTKPASAKGADSGEDFAVITDSSGVARKVSVSGHSEKTAKPKVAAVIKPSAGAKAPAERRQLVPDDDVVIITDSRGETRNVPVESAPLNAAKGTK